MAESASELLDLTLPERFALAQKVKSQLSSLNGTTPEYKRLHAESLRLHVDCLLMAEHLGITRETEVDDVSTSALPYLSLDFHVAQLLDSSPIDPEEGTLVGRLRVIKAAMRKYYDYLALLKQYELLQSSKAPEIDELDEVLPDGRKGKMYLSGRLEKVLKGDLAHQKRKGIHEPRFRMSDRDNDLQLMDPRARRAIISGLRQGERRTCEALRDNWREIELLLKMLPGDVRHELIFEPEERFLPSIFRTHTLADTRQSLEDFLAANSHQSSGDSFEDLREKLRTGGTHTGFTTRLESIEAPAADKRGLVAKNGRILKPFTITRNDLQKQVMGTGQVLPTMSLDELAQLELERRVPDEKPKPKEDEDTYSWADKETERLRRWDDFTDANPRGSGNTMNRG